MRKHKNRVNERRKNEKYGEKRLKGGKKGSGGAIYFQLMEVMTCWGGRVGEVIAGRR